MKQNRKTFLAIILIFLCSITNVLMAQSAVTYTLSGGRLGDNLLSYLHAKWVSYIYKVPMLCKSFPYSDQLVFSDREQRYENHGRWFSGTAEFKRNVFVEVNPHANMLYVVPYFPESLEEHRLPEYGMLQNNGSPTRTSDWPYIAVHWEDKEFLKQIRELVRPKNPMNLVLPPKDCISIAVHVRKNSGGFDLPLLQNTPDNQYDPNKRYVDVIFPLKHVPDDYYLEQIQRIIDMYEGQKFYVFIFTDDPEPTPIVNKYERIINNDAVTFDYRKGENNHYSNVLEDLFSMMQFDCLIRADSNLSIVASKLGDFKVLITPVHHRWEGRKLVIDKVQVTVKDH